MNSVDPVPSKDESNPHPVPGVWRPILRDVVKALAEGDYALSRASRCVAPLTAKKSENVGSNIEEYGETLAELPDEAWRTSIAQWMVGRWDVLVDLWTIESGKSDLVLFCRVFEDAELSFRFEITSVHVP